MASTIIENNASIAKINVEISQLQLSISEYEYKNAVILETAEMDSTEETEEEETEE